MSNGNGHDWSKFNWRDWSGDRALHACSLAARGLWIEMLCIMHEGVPIGYLTVNGRIPTTRQLAAIVGANEQDVTRHTHELEEAGVFSRTTEGIIYSRRMVRDTAASEAGREHIQKRWSSNKPASDPNRDPNSPPNRGPNREATREPISEPIRGAYRDPNRPPISPSSSPLDSLSSPPSDKKKEREPPYPHGTEAVGEGTPASPGTPPRSRAHGSNSRKAGTSPRETGGNPRNTAPRFKSGFLQLVADEGMPSLEPADPIDAFVTFASVPLHGTR